MKKIYTSVILICLSSQINKAQSLFCDDFENGANGWYALNTSGNIVWQQDTFSIGFTPNHVWDIGLDSGYGANEKAALFSPVFNIISPLNLSLCFLHQFSTCYYEDGMHIDYSVDGGSTWLLLGNAGTPYWYNVYFITSSGNLPGWSLSSPIWIQAFYDFGNVFGVNTIQFRFVFTSVINSVSANSGYYIIDNFCLCNAASCNCTPLSGVEESSYTSKSLTIFPNPASTEFQISLPTAIGTNFQTGDEIILRNVLGKIYFSKKITSPTSNFKLQTSNFSNGIYFLQVKMKDGVLNKKVVVEH